MVEDMLEMISDDVTISLEEVARTVSEKHGADPPLSTTTVDNQVDGKSFRVEKVHTERENSIISANKVKRRASVEQVTATLDSG